jgi:hypothetical protein
VGRKASRPVATLSRSGWRIEVCELHERFSPKKNVTAGHFHTDEFIPHFPVCLRSTMLASAITQYPDARKPGFAPGKYPGGIGG